MADLVESEARPASVWSAGSVNMPVPSLVANTAAAAANTAANNAAAAAFARASRTCSGGRAGTR